MSSQTLLIAACLFLTPVLAVAVINHESLQENLEIDPEKARGKVLFFTAPNR